jgi:uncharacterized protein
MLSRPSLHASALVTLMLCLLAAPLAAFAESVFWRVERAGMPAAYVLGSVHVGTPEMYPLPPAVMEAFSASQTLVVELDVTRANPAVAEFVTAHGMLAAGETLSGALGPQKWKQLEAAASEVGVSAAALERQRPWLAAVVLGMAGYARAGFDPALGVDRFFLQHAGERAVLELESVEEQLGVFTSLSPTAERLLLQQTAQDILENPDSYASVVAAWRANDLGELEQFLGALRDAAPELERKLFIDRNRLMARRLHAMLESGERAFIVVGAGHLPGEGGLIELLLARGYRATAIPL